MGNLQNANMRKGVLRKTHAKNRKMQKNKFMRNQRV